MKKKFNLKRDLYSFIVLLVGVGIVIWAYPDLPTKIPSSWDLNGEVTDHMNKFPGAFWGLLVAGGVYLFFYLQLIIDPLKKNYERFGKRYWLIRDIMVTLFVGINLVIIFKLLGYLAGFNLSKLIIILVSILMIALGNYMPSFKRNWFLGIKTPWTVSSEEVWNKTHRLGGKLFVVTGIIGVVEGLLGTANKFFLGAVIITVIVSTGYSYFLYRKLEE